MGKQKKHKKIPEEDKNNVPYYKKKKAIQEKEEPSEMPSTNRSKTIISPMSVIATSTPISKPTLEEEVIAFSIWACHLSLVSKITPRTLIWVLLLI